ncbi:hypothetical protein BS50DRAFT_296227 [Corynespora cassiicola Philippines]|uniref:Uncharacterized protein n=1 Tax=Corynespora cassiicola Philippines TaxID=1448308 RepID=A0A2T2NWH3_CORCC|nr:hypothetical protein BS50DRAFT_296227 [Corynespora cassiicola Philippines]
MIFFSFFGVASAADNLSNAFFWVAARIVLSPIQMNTTTFLPSLALSHSRIIANYRISSHSNRSFSLDQIQLQKACSLHICQHSS